MKLKVTIKKIISRLIKILPASFLMNYIVLESKPDLSDNTKAVFDEMIRRGLNQKYKLIWLVNDTQCKREKKKNVRYIKNDGFLKYWYMFFAKCAISCNGKIYSYRKGQFSMFLGHGIPIKSLRAAEKPMPPEIDYWLATSDNLKELFSYEFYTDFDKGVALGYPRNDAFTNNVIDLHKCFDIDFNKIIVWYPTFRQNHGNISASDSSIALPIIHDSEKAIKLNELAKKEKILIVLKPHFAQDLSYFKDLHLDYIKFIGDDFFVDNNLSSYDFVGNCDALLTDYSSIYFDFMLADKPIGVIWEDFEEYKSRPGFALDMDFYMKGAQKLFSLDDLINFIQEVSEGIDSLKAERTQLKNFVHYSDDGKNSQRVVDFIIEKAGL